MNRLKHIFVISLVVLVFSLPLAGQERATSVSKPTNGFLTLKTNLLYDATATFNLGAEFRLSNKLSLDIPVNYNPFTFSDGQKWRHVMLQPELRLWLRETFRGHFFGVHGHYAFYNVANLPDGPFTAYMNSHRFQGWLVGGGLSYGYQWQLGKGWGMEATVGVGYAYRSYDKFHRSDRKTKIGESQHHYIGPDKVGLSLTYTFRGKKAKPSAPQVIEYTVSQPIVQEKVAEVIEAPVIVEKPVEESQPEIVEQTPVTQVKKGKAFIDYRVGQTAIDPSYGQNRQELQKITTQIEEIVNHPGRTVTRITITAYASPEGTFYDNLRLTEKRAEAMKQHIRSICPLPLSSFTIVAAGEDWKELERLVSESDLKQKEQILTIIRETGVFDGRETKLMNLSGGEPYRQMKNTLFPLLRRTEYEIQYTEKNLRE